MIARSRVEGIENRLHDEFCRCDGRYGCVPRTAIRAAILVGIQLAAETLADRFRRDSTDGVLDDLEAVVRELKGG